MKAIKCNGAGNTFILVDRLQNEEEKDTEPTADQVKDLSRWVFPGYTFDQLIVLSTLSRRGKEEDGAGAVVGPVEIRFWNAADGGEVEACGNGPRAAVAHLATCYRSKYILGEVNLQTGSEGRALRGRLLSQPPAQQFLHDDVSSRTREVVRGAKATVNMGSPILAAEAIPLGKEFIEKHLHSLGSSYAVTQRLSSLQCFGSAENKAKALDILGQRRFRGVELHGIGVASMGNPHCVLLLRSVESLRALTEVAAELGPLVQANLQLFPEGVNVGFTAIDATSREWPHVVFERGAGVTQACGTGACAAGVVCGRLGVRQAEEGYLSSDPLQDSTQATYNLLMPGGLLEVTLLFPSHVAGKNESSSTVSSDSSLNWTSPHFKGDSLQIELAGPVEFNQTLRIATSWTPPKEEEEPIAARTKEQTESESPK